MPTFDPRKTRGIQKKLCKYKLKKLNFMALPNNKDLVSLPECLKELPELAFINMRDINPNLKIPQGLKDSLEDEGMGFFYLK